MTRDQLDAYDALCASLKPEPNWLGRQLQGAARLGETRGETLARRAALGLDAAGNIPLSDHGQRVKAWAKAQAKARYEGRVDNTPCPKAD